MAEDWSPDGKRLLVSYQSSPIIQKATYALFELRSGRSQGTDEPSSV